MKKTNIEMKKIKVKYELAKSAKVGNECACPSCGTDFVKTNYQQAFCKTKKGTKCKDKYWNTVTPEKRNNKTRISPASAAYMASRENSNERLRPMNSLASGRFQGYTPEGYRIFGGIAFDRFDEAVYNVDINEDFHDHGQWND